MARKMKDSGIEWIGKIPEGWEITKIKHIVSSVTDIDHFMPDSAEFGIPYLMIGDLKDLSSSIDWDSSKKISIEDYKKLSIKSRPQIGDIIFARYASIGTTCYIDTDRDFLVSYACLTIHPSDLIIGKFLSYYLKSSSFAEDVLRRTNSNTQGNVGKDSLVNATIVLPSIIEQTQIVNFLDAKCSDINAMLSKTRSSIEEYKKLKQAVITQAVTKGVRGEREMKDSGVEWIGKAPSKWNCIKIKYLFEIRKRIAGKEGYTVLSITQTGIKPKNISSNEGQLADSYSNYQLLHFGEFAMNHMDLLTGWVDISNYNGVTSPDYRVFSLKDTITNHPRYFLYLMQMCYFNRIFYSMAQGVSNLGRWRLQSDKFLNCIFPVPSIEEQKEISDYLDTTCSEIDKLIAKKEQLVKELESYKKSLIYEVVTGKREV